MSNPFDPFGTDLVVSDEGDLVVWPTGALGVISGPDNAIQALKMRMRTALGDLQQHPSYGSGFHAIIGGKSSRQGITGTAFQEIRRLLAQDDRFLYAEGASVLERQENGAAAYDVGVTLFLVNGDAMLVQSLTTGAVDSIVETTATDAEVAFSTANSLSFIGQDEDEDAMLTDLDMQAQLAQDLEREATTEEGEVL